MALDDTTFLIKSFMRPKLVFRAIESIRQHYGNVPVVVVDDSNLPIRHEGHFDALKATLLRLPYDSGLSAGRNAGAKIIETTYMCVMDDDMIITEATRVPVMVELLDRADVVCGSMRTNKIVTHWEGSYELTKDRGLKLIPYGGPYEIHKGVRWAYVEFGLNVLVARTEFVRSHQWDEQLKLSEHTDWFLRMRGKARVIHAKDCVFDHRPERKPEYLKMRRRKEFRLRFFHKHGLRYHIGYSGYRDDWKPKDQIALDALLAKEKAR